jgi:hypothetical protein
LDASRFDAIARLFAARRTRRAIVGAGPAVPRPDGSPAPASPRPPFATLAFIERALAAPGLLTARPDAASLEERARVLTADYWSDQVWLTGAVPEPAFRRVLSALANRPAPAPRGPGSPAAAGGGAPR